MHDYMYQRGQTGMGSNFLAVGAWLGEGKVFLKKVFKKKYLKKK